MGISRSRSCSSSSRCAGAGFGGAAVLMILGSLLAGCHQGPPPPSPAAQDMYVHFTGVRDARVAAVLGDLGALRAAARTVQGESSVAGLPPEAATRLDDLNRRARAIEQSRSLEEAIRLTPVLVFDCGSCHQASGVELGERFAQRTIPGGDGVDRHGQRLGWAVNRLWEGLLGPSDQAWAVGVDALPDGRSFGPEIQEAVGDRDRVLSDRDAFDGLAVRAKAAKGGDERALVLGDVLLVCASCHTDVR